MFWNIVVAEQTKVFKRRLFWIELALLAAAVLVQALSRYLAAIGPGPSSEVAKVLPDMQRMAAASATWPLAFVRALSDANMLGILVVIVLVGTTAAQEYTWHTLPLWLSRGVSRPNLVLAKTIALVPPLVLCIVVPVLVVSLASAYFTFQLTGTLDLHNTDFFQLTLGILRTACTLLPHAALSFSLAIASRSVVAPLGGGVAFCVVEVALLLSGSPLAGYLPLGLVTSLERLNQSIAVQAVVVPARMGGQPSLPLLDPAQAAVGIALWVGVCLALALIAFIRQDLTE